MQNTGGAISDQQLVRWEEGRARREKSQRHAPLGAAQWASLSLAEGAQRRRKQRTRNGKLKATGCYLILKMKLTRSTVL